MHGNRTITLILGIISTIGIIYSYWIIKDTFPIIVITIMYILMFVLGIFMGKSITTHKIASVLDGNISSTNEDITSMIEKFKKGIDHAKPLADLAMHLEEINDKDIVSRIGAAYLIGSLPIFQISMEAITPRGKRETITTVWGNIKEPISSKRIILSKQDIEGNTLVLNITTDEKFAQETAEMGLKVLELIISRWNNLIKMYTDPLTGARTRGYLPIIMNKLRGDLESIAIFMIDLDHFKEVNDTLGHEMGDKVLQEAVKRIKKVMRSEDEVIRYGGDEFIIVVKEVGLRNTYAIAQRIKKVIKNPPIVETIAVTVSIGGAYKMKGKPFNPEKALKVADEALYKAKEKRDTYYIFEVN